ncbi:FtsX-like permease family protein [Hamadaea sp. NPDC050747]|uniref:FtsX-like permease family protein n=1 Tax=Hamadaea sp. NPDC050747 TaxID=3155789 RepID=UPI0033EC8439
MIRFIGAQLRHRLGRSLALFAGVLVATTGFTVLTGSVTTSRLQVSQTVDENFRAAYDILVRPHGERTTQEAERGLVRPNYLSGQYGGITMAQWEQIRHLDGVDVAAPIASLGYASVARWDQFDLTKYVDRSKTSQLLRLNLAWSSDRGLTRAPDAPHYVYITKNRLITMDADATALDRYADGSPYDEQCPGPLEVLPNGRRVPICGTTDELNGGNGLDEGKRSRFSVVQLLRDGSFAPRDVTFVGAAPKHGEPRLIISVGWWAVGGVAAIDPVEESRLVGLDKAITTGRYLTDSDKLAAATTDQMASLPVLTASSSGDDEKFEVGVERLPGDAIRPGVKPAAQRTILRSVTGPPLAVLTQVDALQDPRYRSVQATLSSFLQSGPVHYTTGPDGVVRPTVVPGNPLAWLPNVQISDGAGPPVFASDVGFREVEMRQFSRGDLTQANVVGAFDAARLTGFAAASAVPLQTYETGELTSADRRTRDLLGGQPLRANSNPAGYLSRPPLILTTLAASSGIFASAGTASAPISAVRVRVAGIQKFDAFSRERVRSIAERIALSTGLDVDITLGSSPAPQTIDLPAGAFGRPELRLTENWSQKGAALAIVSAIDRKSTVLFGLILVVCLLFVGNAAMAAVRDRRPQLAVLACLGWPRRRIAGAVLGEVAVIGLLAGLVAAAVAIPLAAALTIEISWRHAAVAIPVATALALLAGLLPALSASRTHPGVALAPSGMAGRRRRWTRSRTVFGLATRNARRLRGRTALGVIAMALGIGALTVIATLEWAFHGEVTGSLLGQVVSVRVRGVDTLAVIATAVLATAAVGDVLYLNVRERSHELAALRAMGWGAGALVRLIAYEGLLIGLGGVVLGVTGGLLAVARFVGAVEPSVLYATGLAALAGVLCAVVAATVPALWTPSASLSVTLAEE